MAQDRSLPREQFLPEAEFRQLVLNIAKLLDGLCVDQIEHALRSASKLCAQGAVFSTDSLAYKLNVAEAHVANVCDGSSEKQ